MFVRRKTHRRITIVMGGHAWAFRHFSMQTGFILMRKLSDMSDTGVGVHKIWADTDFVDLGALPSRLTVKHFPSNQTTENMAVCSKLSLWARSGPAASGMISLEYAPCV